jgi:voltage-gated potassium channel
VPLVVESDAEREAELARSGHAFLSGSATRDDMLLNAGITRARAIVIATGSDADNVYITLTARELHPPLAIHARGESEVALRRLVQAGATRAVSAHQLGGLRMAASLLRPSVVEFVELTRPLVGEEVDSRRCASLPAAPRSGLTVRAIEQRTPRLRVVGRSAPTRDAARARRDVAIAAGDLLVVIGERASVEQIARIAAPG